MTKEKLYDMVLQNDRYCSMDYMEFVKHYLDEFFSQNVVIPKGENRHPDADLFHRAIENLNLSLESDRWAMTWKEDECIFYKSGVIDKKALIRYRIKPSEPVYEWQLMVEENGYWYVGDTQYYTEQEIENFRGEYKKIEETKRERKQ